MHCDKNSDGKNMICLFSRFDADVFVGFPQFCAEKCLDSSKRPFFLLLRQLFSVLTVNSFFAVFCKVRWHDLRLFFQMNYKPWTSWIANTLLVLNFDALKAVKSHKLFSIFYHLQKFVVCIFVFTVVIKDN